MIKILQKTPFSFDVSVWELLWAITYGGQLVFAKPEGHKDPEYLLEVIDKLVLLKCTLCLQCCKYLWIILKLEIYHYPNLAH